MAEKKFYTGDLALAAFLSLSLDIFPQYEILPTGRVMSVFPASAELYTAMESYNAGGVVVAVEYSERLKLIKGGLYEVKAAAGVGR